MPNSPTMTQRIRRLFREWPCSCILSAATLAAVLPQVSQTSHAMMWQADDEATTREGEVLVKDIRIEGNETIPEANILGKIQCQPDRPVSERMIREDKRSLMSTRWFFEVRERIDQTPNGLVLVFTVHERPIVKKVEFIIVREPLKASKMITARVKEKHLKAWTGLEEGSPYDHLANREAINRIEQEYKDKGYYFVKAELVRGSKPGEREVVIRVKEGPRVQVAERTFNGNKFWNDGDLRKNLISKQKFLVFGGHYNPDTIPADIEAVKQYYRSVGFFDIEVSAQPMFSEDKADVNLHYSVKEGRRYAVREIRFEGNSLISTNQLKSGSKLNPGDMFSSYPLSKDVTRMLGYYGDMGHYFASVNPTPQFTEKPGIVDLVFEINEDRPRYVREVNVSYGGDHPHTKQTVVLDRIQVQPGDLADPKKIRRGKSRLNGSGLFEPGLAFDVQPVEPGESSFAMNTTPWRGQSPSHSPDDWTQRFTFETYRSAHNAVVGGDEWNSPFSVGSFSSDIEQILDQDEIDAIEAGEIEPSEVDAQAPSAGASNRSHSSIETAPPQARRSTGSPREALIASNSSDRRQALREGFTQAHSREVVDDPTVANKPNRIPSESSTTPRESGLAAVARREARSLLGGHSFGSTETTIGTNEAAAVEREQLVAGTYFNSGTVAGSDSLEFRTIDPRSFFSVEASTFVASQNMDEAAEPIIRAQSPDARPVDPATPGYTDQVLEGSPYRNQYREVPPGWVDIDVNAQEGRTGKLMFGAGVNSNAGVVGSFVWDESNFDIYRPPTSFADIIEGRAWRGGGQRFRLEAAPGDQVSRYQISWTDPYFLYTDYSLSVSGFYFNRYYPDWVEDRWGGRVAVGRQFTPEWSGNVALRLEEVVMRNVENPHPAFVDPYIGSSFLSTVRVSGTHDTRDSSMMPTEGHYFDAGYEQAFNDFNFPRVDTEFRQYFTLFNRPDGTGRQVLTMAGSLGWSGDDTPVFERYYAGGFQSFRGFAFRGVTPRAGNFSTGGTFQALGTVEYRVPVTADDMINVVAFTDFGTVDDEVTLAKFRASAGFGVRVVIPAMGPVPLAFDFAFPIVKEDTDDEQIFSFYVGINR
jgi:outer membrane protein assembly factor BamA